MSRCATTILSLVTAVALAAPAVAAPVPAAAAAPALQSSASAQNAYCETSDELTLGGVFNLTVDAISGTFAGHPEQQKKFEDNARKYGDRLGHMQISRLLVNTPASQIGGPSREVDDHVVDLVVSSIMKGRNNGWKDTVNLQDITLNEAIESVLTVLYFGGIPLQLWSEVMPKGLVISFLHIFHISTFGGAKLVAKYAPKMIQAIGGFVQNAMQENCISKKNSNSHPNAYNHNPNAKGLPGKMGVNIQKVVDGLGVASESCRPLSEYTLREISNEVISGMSKQVRPEFQTLFYMATKFYLNQLEIIKINQGTIPVRADQIGGIIEKIDNPTITYIASTATSFKDKRAFTWITLGDLTVEDEMNIYTLTTHIAEKITTIMWKILVINVGDKIVTDAVQKAFPVLIPTVPSAKSVVCKPAEILGKPLGVVGAVTSLKPAIAVGALAGIASLPLALPFNLIPVLGSKVAIAIVTKAAKSGFGLVEKIGIDKAAGIPGKLCGIGYKILGLPDWKLDVVPNFVPLLFFYPDYVHPVVHGVVRSVCRVNDPIASDWTRSTDMIEKDTKLAEKHGTYTMPADTTITIPIINKKVSNPIHKDKRWKKYEKDVPQRHRVFDTPQSTPANKTK